MNLKHLSLLVTITAFNAAAVNNGLYEMVAPLVLSSEQLAEPATKPVEVPAKQKGILEQVDDHAAKLSKELSHIEKLRILFNIFALDGDIKGDTLAQHALTEPYILPGAGLPKDSSLIGVIRPKTLVGEAVLAARLSAPLTNLDEIIKRREGLKLLVQNEELRNEVRAIIDSTAAAENSFLNYWDKESQDIERGLKQAFYTLENEKNPFSKWNPSSWSQKLWIALNRYPQYMQFNRINVLAIHTGFIGGGAAVAIMSSAVSLGSLACLVAGYSRPLATVALIYSLPITSSSLVLTKFILWQYRLHRSILRSLHCRLKHVKAIGETANAISRLSDSYPAFANALSLKGNIDTFSIEPNELSKNLPHLLNILSRRVFTREKFGFFSHAGNVLSAHDYMLEVKDSYHKACESIGELSMMLAAAEMIVAYPDRYCFPEFVAQDKPEFTAIGLRNLLFGDNAIPHDAYLGGQAKTRIMLLTGPNGAGKSGLLISATQAIMCAQTLGFAPARSLTMTPFNVIESFANVTENPSKKQSRFMAERIRSKFIMPKLHSLKQGQFAWLGIDEPNSGTTGDVADERTYRLYKRIADNPNVLCIGTTHQEKPTQLEDETEGIVSNFYPEVIRNAETRSWIRTYKIIAGKPDWWFSSKEEHKKMRMQYTKKFY